MTITETEVEVPPFSEWCVRWVRMQVEVMFKRYRIGETDVPFRICPHGGYFWPEDSMTPPMIRDSWGVAPGPGCDDERCRERARNVKRG